jgi:hypothetical protein
MRSLRVGLRGGGRGCRPIRWLGGKKGVGWCGSWVRPVSHGFRAWRDPDSRALVLSRFLRCEAAPMGTVFWQIEGLLSAYDQAPGSDT